MWLLKVEGMTCGGCGASVERVLRSVAPLAQISVHWTTDTVEVRASSLDRDEVADRLASAGFALTAFTEAS